MLRVLLINPNVDVHHPPLGLGYLSSYLKKYIGTPVDVRLFSERDDSILLEVISNFKPDLIGISVVTPIYKRAASLCQLIKDETNIPIIAGGVHITAVPESIMTAPFDVGVIGEGEETFLELVQHFLKTGEIKDSNIAGIVYKENNSLVRTPPRPLIRDLDVIPPPDRRLFNMEHYIEHGGMACELYDRGTSILVSRGCPYQTCNFCSSKIMWGSSVRFFSPQHVVNEMESIVDEYRLNFIISLDDNFTTSRKWLEELCALMEEKGLTKRISLDCESIAGYIDDRKVEILKKMGVIRLEFGFESASPRILNILKDGKARLEQYESAIDICSHYGIMIVGNMICGYIDETPQELEESVNWFRSKPIDFVASHLFTPFPGTTGWKECVERGIINPEQMDWSMFIVGLKPNNFIANVVFPKGKLEQRIFEIQREFTRRNKVVIVDKGLSLKERFKLYSLTSKAFKRNLIKTGTGQSIPWIYYIAGLFYPGHMKRVYKRIPRVHYFLSRLKHRRIIPVLEGIKNVWRFESRLFKKPFTSVK